MIKIADVLGPLTPVINIVDVGAMLLQGQEVAYAPLVKAGIARVTGFEPAPGECERLNAQELPNQTFLPYFIGDGSTRPFHLTNKPMTSSLFEPNSRFLSRFQNLEELTQTVSVTQVETRRLDDIAELGTIDYIKMDVQGAELDVIRGGEKSISGAAAVHVEVEFVPMYKGQPLYGDVDAALRKLGFLLHSFVSMSGRAFKPFMDPRDPNKAMRQNLWAEALYVPDFDNLSALSPERLLKLAAILHEVYHSWDLASLVLANYDARAGGFADWGAPRTGVWDRYVNALVPGNVFKRPTVL